MVDNFFQLMHVVLICGIIFASKKMVTVVSFWWLRLPRLRYVVYSLDWVTVTSNPMPKAFALVILQLKFNSNFKSRII